MNDILSKSFGFLKNGVIFVFGIPVLLLFGIPVFITTIFLYLKSVFHTFSKQELISALKLTTAVAILILFGCLFGYWFAKVNLSEAIENSSISRNKLIFSIVSFPLFIWLIFFCLDLLITIISSEYTTLSIKFNSTDFPKPDSGLKMMFYIFAFIYFSTILVFSWWTK